ncbi:uncharacterized protein LOC110722461 [Chenopodium quinoa]|uniref:uncharacterized protein LOC110722461 n=1 Tax=Chenopodium quinoa TaxID=63459 RepID=UPI000B7984FB|nr:uncharacterized protein LOC110722461 [Chenopodium quinoa]
MLNSMQKRNLKIEIEDERINRCNLRKNLKFFGCTSSFGVRKRKSLLNVFQEEEGKAIDLGAINPGAEENNFSLMLVGKLLTQRSYNIDAFKKTMTTVWAPSHGVKYVDGDEQPEQINLTHSPFWVRIKNLPFNCKSDDHVRAIVGGMGEVLEIEDDIIGIGRYRHVKLLLDITLPLRRFQMIKGRKGRELRVDFAYGRLPFFCFTCGVMGYSEEDCRVVPEEDKEEKLG